MKSILVLVLTLTGLNALAANTSEYTSIARSDCQTIYDSTQDKDAEIDSYEGVCPGKSGYKVKIIGGDIRYALQLVYRGQDIALTNITNFHDMGAEVVEWRRRTNSNRYTSLIYRINISANDEGVGGGDFLYVVRLAGLKSCVVGIVPQGANMNQKARDIADQPNLRCLQALN